MTYAHARYDTKITLDPPVAVGDRVRWSRTFNAEIVELDGDDAIVREVGLWSSPRRHRVPSATLEVVGGPRWADAAKAIIRARRDPTLSL